MNKSNVNNQDDYSSFTTKEEWDSYLKRKYNCGYGLICHSVFIITHMWHEYKINWEKEKTRLISLHKRVLKELKIHVQQSGGFKILYPTDEIIKEFNLFPFIERLKERINEIEITENFIKHSKPKKIKHKDAIDQLAYYQSRKHKGVNKENKIASVWALVLKDEGKTNWDLIEKLLTWIYKKTHSKFFINPVGYPGYPQHFITRKKMMRSFNYCTSKNYRPILQFFKEEIFDKKLAGIMDPQFRSVIIMEPQEKLLQKAKELNKKKIKIEQNKLKDSIDSDF